MSRDTLVSFEGVVKRFGDFRRRAEAGSSRSRRASSWRSWGHRGCGKTTTLRMLAGLEAPSEGVIRLSGKPINDLPTWSRDTPMVWQSLALFPFLNVRENVEFALKMRGVGQGRASPPRRTMAGPDADHRIRRTQHQPAFRRPAAARRAGPVAGGGAGNPAAGRTAVGARCRAEGADAVGAARTCSARLGITFVYVTHSQSEAFSMADRVVIMSRGVIEQIGTPQEIYRTPRTRFVADFLGSSNIFSGNGPQWRLRACELDTSGRVARAWPRAHRVGRGRDADGAGHQDPPQR